METVWEIGNAWTYLGMIAAIIAVGLGWIEVPVAFLLPIPGMAMRAIGSCPYQTTS